MSSNLCTGIEYFLIKNLTGYWGLERTIKIFKPLYHLCLIVTTINGVHLYLEREIAILKSEVCEREREIEGEKGTQTRERERLTLRLRERERERERERGATCTYCAVESEKPRRDRGRDSQARCCCESPLPSRLKTI